MVATIVITAKVYDDDEPLLLMSTPNQGGSMQFNLIPKAANEDKDEKAYNEEEMKDVKRYDDFYGLIAASRARFASHINEGVLHRSTLSSRVGSILVSMMS